VPVIVAGFSPGLLATAILTVNNLRDIKTDRLVNKRTLAVRFGAGFAKSEYVLCILVAGLTPVLLSVYTDGHYFSIVSLVILVLAIQPFKIVLSDIDGPALNTTLANTGKLMFIFSLLFSLGWII
jgi:1,4-dihydroxy-2-naphthoate octaprenyltransferase